MNSSPIYQTIFNNTGTATVIIEADTTISLANTEFEKLSGFSKNEIEGKLQWTVFVHEDDLPRMKEYHYKRRENPASVPRNYEFRVRNRSGDILNVVITIEMIPGTSQSVASLVDITEILEMRKTLEHRLRFEKILTRISGNFINLPREKIDDGVTDALQAIGEFKGADRSYLFLIGPDGIHWSNTHEWCAPGRRAGERNPAAAADNRRLVDISAAVG
jgi:PAS domain S-box-containing protein